VMVVAVESVMCVTGQTVVVAEDGVYLVYKHGAVDKHWQH